MVGGNNKEIKVTRSVGMIYNAKWGKVGRESE